MPPKPAAKAPAKKTGAPAAKLQTCTTCSAKFKGAEKQCPKCLKPSAKKLPIDEKKQAQLDGWHTKYDATYAKYDRGKKGLRKGDLASLVRDANEEFGFLDDNEFGPFVKKSFEEAGPNEESGTVGFAGWAKWYEAFEAMLEQEKQKAAAEAKAKAEAKAAAKAAQFGGSGVWDCDLAQLKEALDAAWAAQKTPLIVDATAKGDGFSPLETFFSYSGNELLEMKKMVVEVNMQKSRTLEEAQAEAREKVVRAMKRGLHLVVLLANSVPPLKSKFCCDSALPYTLVADNSAVQSVLGVDNDWKKVEWTKKLLKQEDMVVVNDQFNVMVVTKFSKDDYAGFLKDELPLDAMQHIVVTTKE